MIVKVAYRAGEPGEETPRRLFFDGRMVALAEVLDRWPGADHRYFKMRGEDGAIYVLRHDTAQDRWELTLYQVPPRRD
jgi:hypothetical protein